MPRKTKPKDWFPNPYAKASDHYQLSEEDAVAILGSIRHAMTSDTDAQCSLVLGKVMDAIADYRWRSDDWGNKPTPNEVRAALQRVAQTAVDFSDALSSLDYESMRLLRDAAAEDEDFPETPREWPGASGHFRLMSLAAAVHTGVGWTEKAYERVPRQSKGRRRHGPAHMLVEDLGRIWSEFTVREFKRSSNRGEARDFVRTVLKIAAPHSEPDIDNLMKAAQTTLRPNRGRN